MKSRLTLTDLIRLTIDTGTGFTLEPETAIKAINSFSLSFKTNENPLPYEATAEFEYNGKDILIHRTITGQHILIRK